MKNSTENKFLQSIIIVFLGIALIVACTLVFVNAITSERTCPPVKHKYSFRQKAKVISGFYKGARATMRKDLKLYSKGCEVPAYEVALEEADNSEDPWYKCCAVVYESELE